MQLFNNNNNMRIFVPPRGRNLLSIYYSCLELCELLDFINKI